MKRDGPRNIVASIQARLLQRSHELDIEHQLTLARFGCERLLYRLSKSEFAGHFILKGAALLLVWLGETTRPTKDVDLLGLGDTSADALKRMFVALCQFQAPEDGLTLVAESVRVEPIREGQEYGGRPRRLRIRRSPSPMSSPPTCRTGDSGTRSSVGFEAPVILISRRLSEA
jgi:hypothetical protein